MTRAHKDQLIRNRKDVVANINIDIILTHLQAANVLIRRDVDIIRSKVGAERRAEYFLDIFENKPDAAFQDLINALKESHQQHIANALNRCAPP